METVKSTKAIVNFGDDLSVRNIMSTTIQTIKRTHGEKAAVSFQVEAVSGKRPFMEVVEEYVVVV